MFKTLRRMISLLLLTLTLIAYQNCGSTNSESVDSTILQGTGTGNPGKTTVDLSFESYSGVVNESLQPINLQNLSMCFKRIRLMGPNKSHNIDFDLNDIQFSADGTFLSQVHIPAGVYQQIKYELRGEDCPSGKSISFTNSHGSFSQADEIELQFEGEIEILATNSHAIEFLMQKIVVALDGISQSNQIKHSLEQVVESFKE